MGIQEDILLLEQSLNELIIKYEQYFLGLEKREPLKLCEEVERYVRRYANVPIINTMLKFKYNALVARFSSYRQHWNRITRLIEDGKYSRDRYKMERHLGKAAEPAAAARAAASSPLEQVYQQYIEARKSCNLPTDNITREMVISALDKQKHSITHKYGTERIVFLVTVQDGKPKIKARPADSSGAAD